MLRQRIITAVLMMIVLIVALAWPSAWPFAILSLLLIAAAAWEWGRLNQAGGVVPVVMAVGLAACAAGALFGGWKDTAPPAVWWAATLIWVVGGALALRTGPSAWPQLPRAARCVIGLLALWAAWLALTHARAMGINFLFSVCALVWGADIAAYFGGRAFGKRKLAPSISPGKSWAGVYSGMAAVVVLCVVWVFVDRAYGFDGPSLYTLLQQRLTWIGAIVAVLLLTGMSVVGDLVESLVKRAAGAKDSSQLLPGHGGVLDRVDALLPVLPIAIALSRL